MTAGRPLTEAQAWTIADRLDAGWTVTAIAADMRLAVDTIRRAARTPVARLPWADDDLPRPDLSDGHCRTIGPEFGDLPTPRAKKVCGGCPVLVDCRELGAAQDQWHEGGPVYGGLTAAELRKFKAVRAEREQPMARWRGRGNGARVAYERNRYAS